jgi:acetyltransferase-like isoleucine patch superfamily enzyme
MNRKLRFLLQLASVPLPSRLKRQFYRRAFGWKISDTARIGLSLIDARKVEMGPSSRVGHFSVIRNLNELRMRDFSKIGQWNWCTAAAPFIDMTDEPGFGVLTMEPHSAITLRHYVDCSGGVTIGRFTTVAGVRSTILSHQIDTAISKQTAAPVKIGEYCFVGSNVCITPGSSIPNRCVIAMGSVVSGQLSAEGMLYAGVPALPKKEVGDGLYFRREKGFVWT